MTKKSLHILNGDSTKAIFEKSALEGDVLVWREMFCEGEVCKEINSDAFWMGRYRYFEEELGVSKLEYFDKSLKEIIKLEDVSGCSEVVLWFEYDLFCQVNMIAACSLLLDSFRKDVDYYLVCVGDKMNNGFRATLSDFTPEDYSKLYENRIKLSRNSLEFAQSCWELYVNRNQQNIQEFDFSKNTKFRFLKLAFEQELKRFSNKDGLNEIELKILEIVDKEPKNEMEILRELLNWQRSETVYGFGDLQYFRYIKRLPNYLEKKNSNYYLNDHAKSILMK